MIKIAQISRSGYEETKGERVDWLDQFAATLSPTAVEAARERDQQSSIQSAVLKLNKHKTVEGVVKEYRDKIGLNDYLNRLSSNKDNIKLANQSILNDISPDLRDKIVGFIRNKIETHRGRVSVPAIQHDVLATFKNNGITDTEINDPSVASFISNTIVEETQRNQTYDNDLDLGRGVGVVDVDKNQNADALSGLMPATGSLFDFIQKQSSK